MYRLLSLLFILIATPSFLSAQEIIRTSRYERTGKAVEDQASIIVRTSDKIEVLRERYGISPHAAIISPSLGDDIILVAYRTDHTKAIGGLVNSESYPDFSNNDAVTAYYILFNKEPVIIGGHAYSFDADGAEYQIHYIKDGHIATGTLSANEAFLSQDGYLLKAWRSKKHE